MLLLKHNCYLCQRYARSGCPSWLSFIIVVTVAGYQIWEPICMKILLTFCMWPTAITLSYRLASLLASKRDHPYSSTLCWLCCSLAFSLLCSAIQSISEELDLCVDMPSDPHSDRPHQCWVKHFTWCSTYEHKLLPVIFLIFTCPSWLFGFIPVLYFHHILLLVYIPITFWLDVITPQVEREKNKNECWEKPQKCMCMSNVLALFFPSLRWPPEVWQHSYHWSRLYLQLKG